MDHPMSAVTADHACGRHRTLAMIALSLATVAIAATAGVSPARLAVLAAAAIGFVGGLTRAPLPGRCTADGDRGHPLVVATVAVAAAVAATGGLTGPLVVLLPAPVLLAWTSYGRGRHTAAVGLALTISVGLMLALPAAATGPALARPAFALLAAWATLIAAAIAAAQIQALIRGLHSASASLDRVRGGVLHDAARRRRGLEAIGAKLAHELKNPLAAIKSLVQLERGRGHHDEASRRRFGVLLDEVARMEATIRDYLSYSRPIDDLDVATVELGAIVDEVLTVLEGRAEVAGIALARGGRTGPITADARRLKEALLNLVSNALEATPRGGAVEVRYLVAHGGARIVVSDTGRGMTDEVAAKIGTPFFTTRDGGTGLGVVIARTAVTQHGGTLAFAPRPSGGTSATIDLPAVPVLTPAMVRP